jgi:hypothetical protein
VSFCYIGKEELKLHRISNIKMLLKSNGKFSVDAGFVASPEDNLVTICRKYRKDTDWVKEC